MKTTGMLGESGFLKPFADRTLNFLAMHQSNRKWTMAVCGDEERLRKKPIC